MNTTGEAHLEAIDRLSTLIDHALGSGSGEGAAPPELAPLTAEAAPSMPRLALVKLALLGDCLRVAELAVSADGVVSQEEVDHVFPLVFLGARFLARNRSDYGRFDPLDHDTVPAFLRHYQSDRGPLGKLSPETEWIGLRLCRRVAREARDAEILELYEQMVTRLMDEVVDLGGAGEAERDARAELARLLAGEAEIAEEADADGRIAAFCDPRAPEVFTAVAQASQVWERDPLDVESVHADAREEFERLVDRVTTPIQQQQGKILLVLGEAGSGKTHLMRAFRNHLHGRRLGYAAYMQMTTRAESFSRYALFNLINSFERPYDAPEVEASALMTLSDSVAEWRGLIPRGDLAALRSGELPEEEDPVGPMVDRLLREEDLRHFDPDLLRVILHLQGRDPAVQARALKYLRCEHLNDYDRKKLGGIAPRTDRDAPQRTLEELSRLVWAGTSGATVLLIDQLEDIEHVGEARELFPRLVDVVRHVAENVPSSIVVLACLEDFWDHLKAHLTRSSVDRLERDPDPVRLTARRSLDEIEDLVACRLSYLYDAVDVRPREDDPLYPLSRAQLHKLNQLRTRDVLDWCHSYRKACVAAGELVEETELEQRGEPGHRAEARAAAERQPLAQAWNDFHVDFAEDPPEDEEALLGLLGDAITALADELSLERALPCERDGQALTVKLPRADGSTDSLLLGICNKSARGGALARQIDALEARAAGRRVAVVRSSQYPANPNTQIFKKLGELLRAGGRRIVMEDSDWRLLMAALRFRRERAGDPGLDAWLTSERPLASLRPLRDLLDLDQLQAEASAAARAARAPAPARPDAKRASSRAKPAPKPAGTRSPATATEPSAPLGEDVLLGRRAGVDPSEIALDRGRFSRHAGFLGSTGSGKTTLALNIIESLLERGVPALLLDRKGDLAGYADPAFWDREPEDPAYRERWRRLKDRVDVRLYTPGSPDGRPLALPVIPSGLAELPPHQRSKTAKQAASALGAMMSYRGGANDLARTGILAKAIELLGELDPDAASLERLLELIDNQDPVLVNAVGRLEGRHYNKLVEHLETLRLHRGELLTPEGDLLNAGELLGLEDGQPSSRTRLSIISTKFLGDNSAIEFWTARLLLELSRWASRNPSPDLQAVALFDEADLYLPATSKPATKEPMLDLLKRSRSAGLGVFLATQNPGDLDYKSRDNINTWFLGRITQDRAVKKMRPLLSELRVDVSARLARQRTGEFFLVADGDVTQLRAQRALLETSQFAEHEIARLAARS